MKIVLIKNGDRSSSKEIFFPSGVQKISIGRDKGNDLVLDSLSVSPFHASVELQGGHWYLSDSGSINGVYLGREKIRKKVRLTGPAVFSIGGTVFEVSGLATRTSLATRFSSRFGKLAKPLLFILILITAVAFFGAVKALRKNERHGSSGNLFSLQKIRAVCADKIDSDEIAKIRDADFFFKKGAEAYYLGNILDAAEMFGKTIELDPGNEDAVVLFSLIEKDLSDTLVSRVYTLLGRNDLEAAEKVYATMESLFPGHSETRRIKKLVNDHRHFQEAVSLFYRRDYKKSRDILKRISLVDEARRKAWLRNVSDLMDFENSVFEIDKLIAGFRFEDALRQIDSIPEGRGADRKNVTASRSRIIQEAEWYRRAVGKNDFPTMTIRGRRIVLLALECGSDFIRRKVENDLRILKKELAERADRFLRLAENAEKEGEILIADNNSYGYDLYKKAYRQYLLADFVEPSPETAQKLPYLEERLLAYIQSEYDSGYVMAAAGNVKKAQIHYKRVLEIDLPGGSYYVKASRRLDEIKDM